MGLLAETKGLLAETIATVSVADGFAVYVQAPPKGPRKDGDKEGIGSAICLNNSGPWECVTFLLTRAWQTWRDGMGGGGINWGGWVGSEKLTTGRSFSSEADFSFTFLKHSKGVNRNTVRHFSDIRVSLGTR